MNLSRNGPAPILELIVGRRSLALPFVSPPEEGFGQLDFDTLGDFR